MFLLYLWHQKISFASVTLNDRTKNSRKKFYLLVSTPEAQYPRKKYLANHSFKKSFSQHLQVLRTHQNLQVSFASVTLNDRKKNSQKRFHLLHEYLNQRRWGALL